MAATSGCILPGTKTAAKAAIGDTCLVGTWSLDDEESMSGYTLNNQPVSVHGLKGASLKFRSTGEEVESFEGSEPLVGDTAGRELSITIRGSFTFKIHADKGKYTETGDVTQPPTSATVDGVPITYHSSYGPGSGTYTCSSSHLTMVTGDGDQTTNWSPA